MMPVYELRLTKSRIEGCCETYRLIEEERLTMQHKTTDSAVASYYDRKFLAAAIVKMAVKLADEMLGTGPDALERGEKGER